jgi:hypothetical protein
LRGFGRTCVTDDAADWPDVVIYLLEKILYCLLVGYVALIRLSLVSLADPRSRGGNEVR